MKLSPSTLKGWQKRFFMLSDNRIRYWKEQADYMAQKNPKGIILMDRVRIDLTIQSEKGL